jgi:hypothetical protein
MADRLFCGVIFCFRSVPRLEISPRILLDERPENGPAPRRVR